MKKIQFYKCVKCEDQIQEEFIDDSTTNVQCSECGDNCVKMLSSPKYFGNTTGRSPATK